MKLRLGQAAVVRMKLFHGMLCDLYLEDFRGAWQSSVQRVEDWWVGRGGGRSNGSEYNSASCAASAIPLTGIATTTRVGIHGHC